MSAGIRPAVCQSRAVRCRRDDLEDLVREHGLVEIDHIWICIGKIDFLLSALGVLENKGLIWEAHVRFASPAQYHFATSFYQV